MFVRARDGYIRSCDGNSQHSVVVKHYNGSETHLEARYDMYVRLRGKSPCDVTRCGLAMLLLRSDLAESYWTIKVTLAEVECVLISLNVTQVYSAQLYSASSVNKPSHLYILSARLGLTCKLCIQNLPSGIPTTNETG
jgi:hypothetical protein